MLGGGRLLDVALRRRFYWQSEFERRRLLDQWGDVTAQSGFPEKFLRLTSGLDANSCETVIRILTRSKQVLAAKKAWLDIFTQEEQKELRLLRDNFYSEILQISDDLFAWRNYLLPINHFEASVFWYRHGLPALRHPELAKGKAVIDAGGYIGDSVLVFQELEPSAVYTFEPVPEHFELLKRTLELNRIANAIPENIALGAGSGTATMRVDSYKGGSSIVKADSSAKQGGHITVPMRALDDYVAEHGLQVGLIKTDLEGAEPDFIAGAKRTICE